MEYSMDRTQVREMLRLMDISHTFNGGAVQPIVSKQRIGNVLEYRIKVPGVAAADLYVRLVDKHIVVSHDVNMQHGVLPQIVASVSLDITMKYDQIAAVAEGSVLVLTIPLNDLDRGLRKEIPVSR